MKVALANLLLVGLAFAIWLRADYLYVQGETDPWWGEPAYWSIVLVCFAMNASLMAGPVWRRLLQGLIACVAFHLILIALVLTIGMNFHFSIGGQL